MGRAFVTVFWVSVLALATFFIFKYMNRSVDSIKEGDSDIVSNIQDRQDAYEKIANPDRVVVTLGDSLYHKPDCSWAGSKSRRMSYNKAIKLSFYPCAQCIEK